jgi:glutaredoxin
MSLLAATRQFLSSKFNIVLLIMLLAVGLFAYLYIGEASTYPQVPPAEEQQPQLTVTYFHMPSCPYCTQQRPIYEAVKLERPDVSYTEYDASTPAGSQLFQEMAMQAGLDTSRLGVPATFVGDNALVGLHSREQLLAAIDGEAENFLNAEPPARDNLRAFNLPILGETDLTKYSLPALAIVLGIIDGFNPCAMWVLVYLIGILVGLQDRKRIWLVVGTFLLASGILYFLLMAAWINVFLFIGYLKPLTIGVGLVALGGGVLSIKEYITTKGELACKVGDIEGRKRTMSKVQRIVSEPLSLALFVSLVGLAFVINSVEFLCSAAIPAVFTQVLALSGISTLQQYLYIGLYVLFFMIDDLIIFGLAVFAINSSFGERYAKYCKLAGGIIMVVLGAILVFAPHLLR